MAGLIVARLAAQLGFDDSGFVSGVRRSGQSLRDLNSQTRSAEQGIKAAMRSAVSDVDRYAAANAAAKSKVTLANREVERSESRLRAARENGNTAKIESAEARLEAARARQLQVNNDARASEAGLEEARRQAAAAADGAAASTERVGQASEGTRGKLAEMVAGGVAVGAMFTSVTSIGMDYERQMNTLQAVSGATAAQMSQVAAKARELGNDVSLPGTSAVDAAAAMTELAKGGFTVEQAMSGAKGSLQLAAAAQIDAAQAAGIQSAALQAFGKDASYAGKAADILSNTSNASSAEIGDVAQALQQAGTVANGFGVNMADTATMIGLFANAGITGSDAGTLLKTALQSLTDQGEPAQNAIANLGLTIYDQNQRFVGLRSLWGQLAEASHNMSEEQFQANTNILFGSDAMRAAMVAAGGGTDAYDKMSAAIGKQGTAAELAAAKMKGLPGAWERVQNALESASLTTYGYAQGALTTMANTAADMIGVGDDLAGTLGFIAAPIGALVSGFGALPGPLQTTIALMAAAKVGSMLFGNQLGALRDRAANAAGGLRISAQEVTNMQRAATVAGGSMNRFSGYLAVMGQNSPTVARMGAAYLNASGQASTFARTQGAVAAGMTGIRAGMTGLMGVLGGPWGLAITGAIAALSLWMSKKREDAATSQEAAQRTTSWADQLSEAGGRITRDFRTNVFKEMDDDSKKLDGSGKSLAATLKDMGVGADTATSAVLREGNAYDDTRRKLDELIKSNTRRKLIHQDAKTGEATYEDVLTKEGKAAKAARDRLDELTGTYDKAKTKAQQTAEANGDIRKSLDGTVSAAGPMSDAMTKFAESTDGAQDKVSKLAKALDELNEGSLTEENAVKAWSDNMRSFTTALQENAGAAILANGHLDVTTEKGSKLQESVTGLAKDFNELGVATYNAGKTQGLDNAGALDATRQKLTANRQAFIDAAVAAGRTREEANKLADAYGLIPDQVVTRLNVNGVSDAINALNAVNIKVKTLEPGQVRVLDNTPDVVAKLDQLKIKYTTLPDGRIAITDTSPEVMKRLSDLGLSVTNLPQGFIRVEDTSPQNLEHLKQIGLQTTTLPGGMVVVNADDRNFQAVIARAQASGSKEIIVTYRDQQGNTIAPDQLGTSQRQRDAAGTLPRLDGALVPMENGGLRWIRKPTTAGIYAGRGDGTVFAEEKTGGESYIPLAPGKRERSTAILSETARLFGLALVRPMENGGMTDDERARMGGGTVNASIWAALKGANPAAKLTAAKTDHDVDGGLHPKGEAIDVDPSPANLNWAWSNRDQLAMIISAADGGQKNWYNMNGERAEGQAAVAIYGPDVVAQHANHIHLGALHEVGGDGYTPGMIAANDTRSPQQRNIDAVIAEGKRRKMSPKQIKAAVMAVLTESGGEMYANPADPESMNMPHDAVGSNGSSTGIFQQQNNGAWGTLADRMDATKSAGMFYDKLATVDQNLSEGQMAQAVQQSAFADGSNYTSRAADADKAIAESNARGNGMSIGAGADNATPSGAVQQVFVTNWPSTYGTGDTSSTPPTTSATASGSSSSATTGRPSATSVQRAQGKVTTATTAVDDAKRRQADAAGRLHVAEMRLEEVRRKGNATGSQVAAAEEGVAKARRASDSATGKVALAERKLEDARKGLSTAQATPGNAGVVGVGPLPLRAYATGDIASRGPGGATMLNSERMWVTRAREMGVDEAFIPVDGSPRSWALWLETGRRMGKVKEFGGGGFGGYTVDTTDAMAPKNFYDWASLGVGGAMTVASVIAPYIGMASSGQVNLGDLAPVVDTGNNTVPGAEQLRQGADAISKQIDELIKAVREGKNIHVTVNNDDGPASMVLTRGQM